MIKIVPTSSSKKKTVYSKYMSINMTLGILLCAPISKHTMSHVINLDSSLSNTSSTDKHKN